MTANQIFQLIKLTTRAVENGLIPSTEYTDLGTALLDLSEDLGLRNEVHRLSRSEYEARRTTIPCNPSGVVV